MFIHMTSTTIFPDEILDLILRARWPGLRLGLTCRRFSAQITDELIGRWAALHIKWYTSSERPGEINCRMAQHHALPNGVFHGLASVEESKLDYRRGKVVSGMMRIDNRDTKVQYHGNILIMRYGGAVAFAIGDVLVWQHTQKAWINGEYHILQTPLSAPKPDQIECGIKNVFAESWADNVFSRARDDPIDPTDDVFARMFIGIVDPVKWIDSVFEQICEIAGDDFRVTAATERAKINAQVYYPGIKDWPDCVHDPRPT